MTPTPYYADFLEYFRKAKILQDMNIASPTGRDTSVDPGFDDPIMKNITIYDCVERRYAGFSNALQQVWFGSDNPKQWQALNEFDGAWHALTELDWLFVMLIHRITGSGASFSTDHGFRNSIVADMVRNGPQAGEMKRYVLSEFRGKRKIFTSIGNQPPQFSSPPSVLHAYSRPSEYYIDEFAPRLCYYMLMLLTLGPAMTVAQVADAADDWNRKHGLKRFTFCYTAWAMDIAEYFPHYVDPHSHVHYGKNALETLNLMFENFKTKQVDAAMNRIRDALVIRGYEFDLLRPYSLEDVLCDYTRYIERYVPKGYEHLTLQQLGSSSSAGHTVRHWSYAKTIGII